MNVVSYAAPHRSPATVQRDITQTRNELLFAPQHNLTAINANIAHLTAKAIIDPQFRGELKMAMENLDRAEADVAAKHALSAKLELLEAELVESERLEGVAQREEASRQMSAAINEFKVHALNAGRAYRQMVLIARRVGMTQRLPDFHSSTLVPMSWTGTVSEILVQHPDGLPDLVPAKDAA